MPRKHAKPDPANPLPAASIRPRLLCRGNNTRGVGTSSLPMASIRPRLLCRGNCTEPFSRIGNRCRFNSAAAVMPRKHCFHPPAVTVHRVLQFGRGCYAAETPCRREDGPRRRWLQFGRGCYAAETSGRSSRIRRWGWSFNSAAAVMPRKPDPAGTQATAPRAASIRPRLLCRGNLRSKPQYT